MLCKVSSSDKGSQTEAGNQKWEHHGIPKTGFHHQKSEKQGREGYDESGKKQTLEQVN